ncbi:MAG: hypothetical protein WCC87_15885 [Candidatus Korobacteraceae bacterium]
MIWWIAIFLVLAVPAVVGFVTSRRQRQIDRGYFAAYLGFGASLVAITITFVAPLVVDPPYPGPTRQGFLFVLGCIWLLSELLTFFAGLFSRGLQRVALVAFAIVIGVLYIAMAIGHSGY